MEGTPEQGGDAINACCVPLEHSRIGATLSCCALLSGKFDSRRATVSEFICGEGVVKYTHKIQRLALASNKLLGLHNLRDTVISPTKFFFAL